MNLDQWYNFLFSDLPINIFPGSDEAGFFYTDEKGNEKKILPHLIYYKIELHFGWEYKAFKTYEKAAKEAIKRYKTILKEQNEECDMILRKVNENGHSL